MLKHEYAVIMAGGGGTRLWPVSRKDRPKQLLPLIGEQTLLQGTVARLEGLFERDHIYVVTVNEQVAEIQRQVPEIPPANYLIEPAPRGTASVVGLAAVALTKRDADAVMAVLPSDHFIRERDLFKYVLREALDVASRGFLVTLGIAPTSPSTAYGYVQQGKPLDEKLKYPVYHVEKFTEKPDEKTAQQFLQSREHSWNSGMFVWRADMILGEIDRQMPALSAALKTVAAAWGSPRQASAIEAAWPPLKAQTIDYGVMEHAERVVVVPASGMGWSDVGAWDSLFEVLLPDMRGNVSAGAEHLALETHNTLVYGQGADRLIVTIGMDDTVIVDTGDVLLVCKSDQAQKVRDVVEHLRKHQQDYYL
ncbi:MAG TPA: sugar phosphate nucleotidyltransferase [Anaerolineales bacterium]|nr:sugar phosphate nucleotidyltransferase [Anaerolineales bacterium]